MGIFITTLIKENIQDEYSIHPLDGYIKEEAMKSCRSDFLMEIIQKLQKNEQIRTSDNKDENSPFSLKALRRSNTSSPNRPTEEC